MFPEYRELISRLKTEGTNTRFLNLFEKHNALDSQISNLEALNAGARHTEIGELKREKLRLKEEIYAILKKLDEGGK
ncbi:MAG: DUF465 domain-containing protein [Ottowia sp.]|nr:DUF465 domain-containing protein [Ottowia sp.]